MWKKRNFLTVLCTFFKEITRYQETLFVMCSSLNFWRAKVLIFLGQPVIDLRNKRISRVAFYSSAHPLPPFHLLAEQNIYKNKTAGCPVKLEKSVLRKPHILRRQFFGIDCNFSSKVFWQDFFVMWKFFSRKTTK